jgi:hypothetical protein
MRIGEILVSQGTISLEQLEEALRTQAFFGGRLGTSLVELAHCDLDLLTAALSMQMGVPGALHEHFDRVKPAAIALLPRTFAEKHAAIPLGLAKGADKSLVVAFREPRDQAALAEVGFATGRRVTPAVAPELRIFYYLEKYCGIARKNRYVRLERSGDRAVRRPVRGSTGDAFAPSPPGEPGAEREVSNPSRAGGPSSQFQVPEAAPAAPLLFDDPPVDTAAATVPTPTRARSDRPAMAQPAEVRSAALGPTLPAPTTPAPTPHDATVAGALIANAQSRDQIGDALLGFLRSAFGCGLLLIAKDDMALGWKGFAPGVEASVLESIAMPLGTPSMLRAAWESRAAFRGPAPSEGAALQARLWKLLRVPAPGEVLVVPILLRERVVNLVYAQAAGGGQLPEGPALELTTLAAAAAAGYARLIQRTKQRDPAAP